MVTIGKNILGNLTTGMYKDSKIAYREYIQNACDQIDKAIEERLITKDEAEVNIWIDSKNRSISIEDNATGVEKDKFLTQLGDIANSDKKLGKNKGFRGIGRLCGLAYCRQLIFSTSFKGEPVESVMIFNAKKMRALLEAEGKDTVENILYKITTVKENEADIDSHYFKVELIDINEDNKDLLDVEKVKDYLSFVAPVPYTNKFSFAKKIYKHAKEIGSKIDEYSVYINGDMLFKEYKTTIYSPAKNGGVDVWDKIRDVKFHDFYDDDKKLIAWMWYGISRFDGALNKLANPMYGLRVRQGNIQIGDSESLTHLFKEHRGNSYYIGEVFAVAKNLIPNSQRDYFNENRGRSIFENLLKPVLYTDFYKLYHDANIAKGLYKHIESLNTANEKLQEKREKGFVDNKEKNMLEANVIKASQIVEKEGKKLIELENTSAQDRESAIAIVRNAIKEHYERKGIVSNNQAKTEELVKAQEDTTSSNKKERKPQYFADQFSHLSRDERKIVTQIMSVVNKIAPEEIANKIQKEVAKKLRKKGN